MGLFDAFKDEKKVSIATQVYSLGEDVQTKAGARKQAVLAAVLSSSTADMAQVLVTASTNSSMVNLKKAYTWARANAPTYMFKSTLTGVKNVDPATVQAALDAALALASNKKALITEVIVDVAAPPYFVEYKLYTDRPDVAADAWEISYDAVTDEFVATVIEEGGGTTIYRYPVPADYTWSEDANTPLLMIWYTVLTTTSTTVRESATKLFTYRLGTGVTPAFEAVWDSTDVGQEYYPAMHVWRNGKRIDQSSTTRFDVVKEIYKQCFGSKLTDFLDTFAENDNVGKIDNAYIVLGVPLNTEMDEGKNYIFRYVRHLQEIQTTDLDTILANQQAYKNWVVADQNYRAWQSRNYDDLNYWERQRLGEAPPLPGPMPILGELSKNQISLTNSNVDPLKYRLYWNYVKETFHIGNVARRNGDAEAELLAVGKHFFEVAPDFQYQTMETNRYYDPDKEGERAQRYLLKTATVSRIWLYKQVSAYSYIRLEVCGFTHENRVHSKKSAYAGAKSHLTTDGYSGFLIPLNQPIVQEMGAAQSAELAPTACYLVINSSKETTVKWYQKGAFRLLLAIGVAVLGGIVTGGAGLGAAIGILGANAAVGAALGFTSVIGAAIAGAVANGIVAVVLTTLIQKGSVRLFGEKWGAVIGAVAAFFAINATANFMSTGTLGFDFSTLVQPKNLTKLTSSVSEGYTKWLEADRMEMLAEMDEYTSDYKDALTKIQDAYEELVGDDLVDPLTFTEIGQFVTESSDTFLTRTLLTGSDIAELTHSVVTNFADLSLSLPDAFS